jgi:ubiquinone biosynthesis protein
MLRIIDVLQVIVKYNLEEHLFQNSNFKLLSIAKLSFKNLFGITTPHGTFEYRLRCALEELGPVFIKFGQMLSSRPDLIPASIVKELKFLRESVKPFSEHDVEKIIELELKNSTENIFKKFDKSPIAAGSVAQVHYAELHTGELVAVKILRPKIECIIKKDIKLFRNILQLIFLYNKNLKKIKIEKILDELSNSLMLELDLLIESDHMKKFASNMKHVSYVCVPKVYDKYSTKTILVMERMFGIPIDQKQQLIDQGVDVRIVVQQGVEVMMLQLFRDGFFHADQHPGNLWIKPDGSRIYLDFGIVGSITEADRKSLLQILFFLYSKNNKKTIEKLIDAGWLNKNQNLDQLEVDLIDIAQLFVNRKQKDFSIGNVLNKFFNLVENYQGNVPYQFTLLVKTILVTEGIVKQLTPDLNIQSIAEPVLLKFFTKSFT